MKRDKVPYTHGTIVKIYIICKCSSNTNDFNFALENCLFGAVKLTKNADIDKYKCLGYGIEFDARGSILFPNSRFGQNVIIFGVDMSSCAHANSKKNNMF